MSTRKEKEQSSLEAIRAALGESERERFEALIKRLRVHDGDEWVLVWVELLLLALRRPPSEARQTEELLATTKRLDAVLSDMQKASVRPFSCASGLWFLLGGILGGLFVHAELFSRLATAVSQWSQR